MPRQVAGTGTPLELAMVWELKNKGFINRSKPIILVGESWRRLVDLILSEDSSVGRFVNIAESPNEITDYLGGI